MSTRLVIADDHAIWRSGLRADLGEAYAVVGEAGDGAEAIEVIRRERPDLALVDGSAEVNVGYMLQAGQVEPYRR